MHTKLLLFIISSLYLSLSSALNCSDEPFDCGNIAYIAYPFWGGLRTSKCGRKGFEIVCNTNNIPIIKISSLSYILHKLDFVTNTLTVARLDLLDTYCPKPLRNTTIDWDLYKYPPNSTHRNLILYYDCTANQPPLLNSFTCANHSSNLFHVSSSSFSAGITCDANIYVPVNKEDAQSLLNPTPSSINILRSALTTGFSIQWFNDTQQGTETYCNKNIRGSCAVAYSALIPNRPFCNKKLYESCLKSSENQGRGVAFLFSCKCDLSLLVSRAVFQIVSGNAPSPAPLHNEDATPTPMPPLPTQTQALPPNRPSRVPLGSDSNTQVNNGKNRVSKIVLVVPLTVAGMVIASISIHCFLRRRGCPNPERKHDVETFLLQQGSLAPKRYKYSEIKKITKSFSDKLGQGGYGSVYKGFLPDGRPVAVKILIQIDSNGEEFINEVASISRTSHVNIVTLLGFCYEASRRALVYEYMPNNSLDKFLPPNKSHCSLDLEQLYKIAVGIAKGLEYLHKGCNTRIVHFDIKPQNILLDEDLCPKISDFGLAKLYKKKQSVLSVLGTRGTAGYIAPEVFSRNFGEVSHKSDVYSYGMMLLEIAQGRKFDEDEVIQSSEKYFPDKIYEEVISDVANIVDWETEGEEETRNKMLVAGFWCIQTIPSNRPSISKVVEMLEGSLESMQIPPKPFLFSPNLPSHREISSSLSACDVTQNSAQY